MFLKDISLRVEEAEVVQEVSLEATHCFIDVGFAPTYNLQFNEWPDRRSASRSPSRDRARSRSRSSEGARKDKDHDRSRSRSASPRDSRRESPRKESPRRDSPRRESPSMMTIVCYVIIPNLYIL